MEYVMSPHVLTFVMLVGLVSFALSCGTLIILPTTISMKWAYLVIALPCVATAGTAWLLRNVA